MPKTHSFVLACTFTALALSAQSPPANPVRYQFSLSYGFSPHSTVFDADAVDAAGNVYFSGSTASALPATPGAFQSAFAACPAQRFQPACSWAFVGKLSPTGALLWLTYVPEPNGSSAIEQLAVDGAGGVYLAGTYAVVSGATSAFPVTSGAFETTPQNGSGVFVAKLSSTGSKLVWARYFNGMASVSAIQPDNSGNLLVGALAANSVSNLPLVDPLSGTEGTANNPGAYLAKLNSTGSGLLFATWVGAPGGQASIAAIRLDGSGNSYIAGACANTSPGATAPCVPITPGAYQTSAPGGQAAFIMKLGTGGTLAWSSLLAGTALQSPRGIALDAAGNVTIAGEVLTTAAGQAFGFPVTPGAFQTSSTKLGRYGSNTGFLAKLDASGSSLLYATYFGGSSYDNLTGLVLDAAGNAVFSGFSDSPDLPVSSDAWEPCHPPPDFDYANGADASFIAVLSPDGKALRYGSFIGRNFIQPDGQQGDAFRLVGMDAGGDLYFAGTGDGFPTITRYRVTSRPQGSLACIANGTHGYGSAASPLGLLRLRGNNIAGGRSFSPAPAATGLPLSYNGLQVLFGNAPAPLLGIAADQITVFAPYSAPPGGTASIRITQDGMVTAELDVDAQPAAPGIMTVDGSGVGSAAAIDQDGSLNSHASPAAPGSVVSLYLTGLGRTVPVFVDGLPATLPGSLQQTVQVSLYNIAAQVLYAGPAPGLLVGVYQVNFQVPITGLSDWVPLGIKVGDQDGQAQPGNAAVGVYVSCPPQVACKPWP